MWQQLQDELGDNGFTILAIALDADGDAVRQWANVSPLTMPVLIDRDFVVADYYGFVNVPSSVWIDENRKIVRPADTAMGDDRFRAFTNIDADVHHDLLRAWVLGGTRDLDDTSVRANQLPPSDESQRARLHRRIALALREQGDLDGFRFHLDAAESLAPHDWTIRRGNMPMKGDDPFGEKFFEFVGEFNAAGRPGAYPLRTGYVAP